MTASYLVLTGVRASAAVGAILLAASMALAATETGRSRETPDPWERNSGVIRPTPETCAAVDRVFIAPVSQSERANAISQLDRYPVVTLDAGGAAKLLNLPQGADASPTRLLQEAIAKLESQKRLEIEQRIGSWSVADQNRLEELERLARSPNVSMRRPYLARAISKNESGMFRASLCSDILWVSHFSLGVTTPPSLRSPIVVYLERQPRTVYADWGMAR